MYRLYLTFFFVLFCSHFATNAQQMPPTLRSISVDTTDYQAIAVSWLYEEGLDSVVIYKCTANCNGTDDQRRFDTIAIANITDLKWIDKKDTTLSVNHYRISRKKGGMTPTQSNMVLNISSDNCRNAVTLSWNPYLNMLNTFDHYNILCRVNSQFFTLLDTTTATSYSAKSLQNNTDYEFVIQAVSKTDSIFAFSNIVFTKTGEEESIPDTVRITGVKVINEDREIEIKVETNNLVDPDNFSSLFLEKCLLDEVTTPMKRINTWYYNSQNVYTFTDKEVEPRSKLYKYQATVIHQCKPKDLSNIVTNILLEGFRVDEENFQDSISFIQKGDSLPQYYSLFGNEEIFLPQLTIKDNRHLISVEQYIDDGSIVVYQVKSEEDWISNTLLIASREPTVDFPNAFCPKSLVPQNQIFYPIIDFPLFVNKNEYLFIIYNRWGQELYRTSELPPFYPKSPDFKPDSEWGWDGTFQGKECPAGIYAYKLSFYNLKGKKRVSKSGTVLLVR
jgi:hypothetical protein